MAHQKPQSSAAKALQKELADLHATPVEGFKINLSAVENMFEWDVSIFGPPMTLYEGGYFKARLCFPNDYPYSPPTVQFLTKMFHPNIYESGEVCISILHSPGDDPQSGELASERWNPTQCVRTILLSVISLLNEPNIYSAAHVDASVSYRRWKESNGRDDEYEKIVKALVQQTFADAERDGVQVPTTLEEYCISGRPAVDLSKSEVDNDSSDFDGDYGYCASDVEDEDDDTSTPDVKQAASSGALLDTGADSAMEETESEPHIRSKHNIQSVYQHSGTSITSQVALHSSDCEEMITDTACASASKSSSDISDNASTVMKQT
ncbi:hypothetical protein EG68_04260 [Paragonimus skrjabini miyazakii]|uniref:UBC core domain-containing protein n=1 Tax=Paragonimus skrjabini miyazakii TaxID=59628 RepID=A0A8S9YWT1_9TREM|nr:hypothetical protein EG68_04260 [Paragonimus skrjabini miyazakii]